MSVEVRPRVGQTQYLLERDGFDDGAYVVRRTEIVGVFETREEARQWMIDTTEERKARDGATHVAS